MSNPTTTARMPHWLSVALSTAYQISEQAIVARTPSTSAFPKRPAAPPRFHSDSIARRHLSHTMVPFTTK